MKFRRIWKFSPCEVYKQWSGCIFTIYVSINEVVCYEVLTHYGSSLLATFGKKGLGTFLQLLRPKTKMFALKFRRILEVFILEDSQKEFWANFHDSNEAVCCKVQAHFALQGLQKGRIFMIFASKHEDVCCEFRHIL